jgi:hypothetical protein
MRSLIAIKNLSPGHDGNSIIRDPLRIIKLLAKAHAYGAKM